MPAQAPRSPGRRPRSRFYDGPLYAGVMDRLTAGLHDVVARQVGAASKVLDVGSGTGATTRKLAATATEVIGVELSPAMWRHAKRSRVDNVSFVLGDVTEVFTELPDGHFEVATMVMVLHELPSETREPVLREVTRIARRLLCVDFSVPMPRNAAGLRNRFFELAAGPEHFGAFRDFNARGGTHAIARTAGLSYRLLRHLDAKTLEMSEITA